MLVSRISGHTRPGEFGSVIIKQYECQRKSDNKLYYISRLRTHPYICGKIFPLSGSIPLLVEEEAAQSPDNRIY